MINLLRLFVGIIVIPVVLILVFTGLNGFIAFIALTDFLTIHESPIWLPWTFVIFVFMYVYFNNYPIDNP